MTAKKYTPEEIGNEIFNEFFVYMRHIEDAKQCALLCVQFLIIWSSQDDLNFWRQVQNEIKKIE